jgi:hypothetical protein
MRVLYLGYVVHILMMFCWSVLPVCALCCVRRFLYILIDFFDLFYECFPVYFDVYFESCWRVITCTDGGDYWCVIQYCLDGVLCLSNYARVF